MQYRVLIHPRAARHLERLHRGLRERVIARLVALGHDPRPRGIRQLKPSLYRLRVGDYRVVYTVDDDTILVLVLVVLPRKEVYRFLKGIGIL
jgi:mRNA interferase RelE/StbE